MDRTSELWPQHRRSYDFLYSFVGDLPTHLAWRNSNKGRLLFRRPTKAKIRLLVICLLTWLGATPTKAVYFFEDQQRQKMGAIELRVGSGLFRQQIIDGKSEEEIRASWEPGLSEYKEMRKKYLLYP
jgi:hypothetical protein